MGEGVDVEVGAEAPASEFARLRKRVVFGDMLVLATSNLLGICRMLTLLSSVSWGRRLPVFAPTVPRCFAAAVG